MKIELISQEQLDRLLEIQKEHPLLTYQNNGYDYPDKTKWSEEDNTAFKEVQTILGNHIKGFYSLNHFRISKKGEIEVRFQYNYGYDGIRHTFSGVGYISLRELTNGFD